MEAEPTYPAAAEILALIRALYQTEAAVQATAAGDPTVLLAERRTRVAPVVETIRTWVTQQRALSQSALGKALACTTALWPGLVAFLDDAAIPMDNNATQRALRGMVLGRKTRSQDRGPRRGGRRARRRQASLPAPRASPSPPPSVRAGAGRRAQVFTAPTDRPTAYARSRRRMPLMSHATSAARQTGYGEHLPSRARSNKQPTAIRPFAAFEKPRHAPDVSGEKDSNALLKPRLSFRVALRNGLLCAQR